MPSRITNDLAAAIGKTLAAEAFAADLHRAQEQSHQRILQALQYAYTTLNVDAYVRAQNLPDVLVPIRSFEVFGTNDPTDWRPHKFYSVPPNTLYFTSPVFAVHEAALAGTNYLTDIDTCLNRVNELIASERNLRRQIITCAKQARTVEKLIELWPEATAQLLAPFLNKTVSSVPSFDHLVAQHRPSFLQENHA